jgi:chaperonin cofactor prefoldin
MTEFLGKTQCKLVDLVTHNVKDTFGNTPEESSAEASALCEAIDILNSKMQESSDNVDKAIEKIGNNGLSMEKMLELQNDHSVKIQSNITSLASKIDQSSSSADKAEMSKLMHEFSEKTAKKSVSEITKLLAEYSEKTVSKSTACITNEINKMMNETSRQTSSSPTPNASNDLILSMNQKILRLTSLCEQMRAAQTGRMQVLEERIRYLLPQEQTQKEPLMQTPAVVNGIDEIDAKLGRISRESNANHDVNQAWFTRVHELNKNIARQVGESSVKSCERDAETSKMIAGVSARIEAVQSTMPKIITGMEKIDAKLDDDSITRSIQGLTRAIESLGKKSVETSNVVDSLVSKITKSSDTSDLKSSINSLSERLLILEKMGEDHQTGVNALKTGINGIIDTIHTSTSPDRMRSPSPSGTQHLVRLVESIHSTLVSYLPMDNSAQNYAVQQTERKLDEILKMVERGFVHARHQPGGSDVEAYHKETVARGMRIEGQMDSINASLERISAVDLRGVVGSIIGEERKGIVQIDGVDLMRKNSGVGSKGGKPLPQPPSRN